MRPRVRATLLLATGLWSASGIVHAQLEEVIVTAQKRQESLQDVPITVNVVAGERLADLGVFKMDDVVNLFPNMSRKSSSAINTGISIRGVGTENVHPIAPQAVGQYVDEVSLVSPFTSQLALFDLERIEVLRGPQNTLFGRNTTGGAINYISRKPDVGGEIGGYLRLNAGNEGRLDAEGALNLPLGETWAARLAVQTLNRDGVFHDLLDGDELGEIERNSGRLQLAWEPTNATELIANVHAGYSRGKRTPERGVGDFAANGIDPCPVLTQGVSAWRGLNECVTRNPANGQLVNLSTADWNDVFDAAPAVADVDSAGTFVRLSHAFDGSSLTSITSYDVVEVQETHINLGATPFLSFWGGGQGEWNVFSQELRLTSTGEGRLKWIIGGLYSTEDDTLATLVRNGSVGTPPFTTLPHVDLEQEVEIWSLYGQLQFALSNRVDLTAGLRFTSDEKEADSTVHVAAGTDTGTPAGTRAPDSEVFDLDRRRQFTAGAPPCPPPPNPCRSTIPVRQNLDDLAPKLSIDFRLSDRALAYAGYTRGFKSGAFDTRALAAFRGTADEPTEPEFLDAYEIGVKSNLLDGHVELNGAVFFYQWEDMQVFDSDPATGAPAFLNVPESEILGVEAELRWASGNGWFVHAGAGWLESEVTDAGGLSTVAEGSRIVYAPELSLNGLVRKDTTLGQRRTALQADFRYVGEQTTTLNEDPTGIIDSAFFINARASIWFGSGERFELSLWGENLGEEKTCYQIGDIGSLTFANTCTPNEGMAFYGASLRVAF